MRPDLYLGIINSKLTYLLACSLLFFITSQSTEATGIFSVHSYDGFTVWAVGPSGNVIRSSDAGVTWNTVNVGSGNFYSVVTFGSYIWITGDTGIVQRSSNNGSTWELNQLIGAGSLKSVHFANAFTGWVAGSGGKIYKTTDRGSRWNKQTVPTTNNLNSIKFIDIFTGVACGLNGTILVTTNGGDNWTVIATSVNKELLSVGIKRTTIIAVGVDATVIKSTNFGASWSSIDYKMQSRVDVNGLHMADTNFYITVGGGGFVRKSLSVSDVYMFGTNPYFGDLYTIYLNNYGRGWAAGRNSNIVIRTTDAGTTWEMPAGASLSTSYSLVLPTDTWTYGNVFSINPMNKSGIVVATGRSLFRSLDKGDTWTRISYLDTIYFLANSILISPKDSNLMLVTVGTSGVGKILRTTNYGATWSSVFNGRIDADDIPLCLDPNHPDTVYFTPYDSVVLRSTNFGLIWNPAGPQRFSYPCVIKVMEGYSNILLLGKIGVPTAYLYRSTDYGLSWAIVDSTSYPNGEVPALAESNLNPGTVFAAFLGGNRGGIHISPNSGGAWLRMNNNALAWPLDIARDDYNVIGFAEVNQGHAFISSNGGFGFSSIPISNAFTQAMLLYDRSTMLIQNSIGIYKVRFTYNVPIGITPISQTIPQYFLLHQNYPNPFNPTTRIKFDVPFVETHGNASLRVFDALGREITTLLNEPLKPGTYEVEWNASNFPSGMYLYVLTAGDYKQSAKMILLK
jgi:photosystem II stability/assembly factor-like uncharacterized protein